MEKLRCNMCDQLFDPAEVSSHLEGRGHAVKKKVAEFNEMNALLGRKYDSDVSVVNAWIRDLYMHDFLTSGQA